MILPIRLAHQLLKLNMWQCLCLLLQHQSTQFTPLYDTIRLYFQDQLDPPSLSFFISFWPHKLQSFQVECQRPANLTPLLKLKLILIQQLPCIWPFDAQILYISSRRLKHWLICHWCFHSASSKLFIPILLQMMKFWFLDLQKFYFGNPNDPLTFWLQVLSHRQPLLNLVIFYSDTLQYRVSFLKNVNVIFITKFFCLLR